MNTVLINAVVAVAAILLIYAVWGGVHLLARRRMGVRQIGCRGPVIDDFGNEVCCHTGERCEKNEARDAASSPPSCS